MDPAPPPETWAITSRNVRSRRVEASIDGVPVWVESDKLPLADTPEAWVTAFCLAAARVGAHLRVDRPVDPTWRAAANANVATTSAWWGGASALELDAPEASDPSWHHRVRPRPKRDRRRAHRSIGRALSFSGGVDSFFSLLQNRHVPSHLLFVVGFDVDVDDAPRVERAVELVRSVAKARRVTPIIVRTDLRRHPRFASIGWDQSHGAAVAAIGHLLSPVIGTIIIPPSYAVDRLIPWGSRPDIDPRWSVPGRTEIEHGDATERRIDRVLAIAEDPLVQRHLWVCRQNESAELNCGRCETCVRTMTALAGAGVLDDFAVFPSPAELPARIDALEIVAAGLIPTWGDLVALDLEPEVRSAVEALIGRSSPR